MITSGDDQPPRPLSEGDIVAGFSDDLGEWSAAQVTHLNHGAKTASVTELDWSGPRPSSIAELGDLTPLRLTHHFWNGTISSYATNWLLPRSYSVIGNAIPLSSQASGSFSGWHVGDQLAAQRQWDADPTDDSRPGTRQYASFLDDSTEVAPNVYRVSVSLVKELDCALIVRRFPNLTTLALSGDPGILHNAGAINRLTRLRRLKIVNLFGMEAAECPMSSRLVALEDLYLHNIPAEFAQAARREWTPEIAQGCEIAISGPRAAKWVRENFDNPLRGWDGNAAIPAARYTKALALYRRTRTHVLATLSTAYDEDQMIAIGRAYGLELNALNSLGRPFIFTSEREDLIQALDDAITFAEVILSSRFPRARRQVIEGVDAARDW